MMMNECLQIKLNRSWFVEFLFLKDGKSIYYYGYLKNFEKRKRSVLHYSYNLWKSRASWNYYKNILVCIRTIFKDTYSNVNTWLDKWDRKLQYSAIYEIFMRNDECDKTKQEIMS